MANAKNKENQINTIVTINKVIWPQNSNGNCWGIVKATTIVDNGFNKDITLKGDLPEIDFGSTYKLLATETIDKYGVSYQINLMVPYVELKNEKQWKMFLYSILSENQAEALFSSLEDPIQVIKDNNIAALCQVKGIKTAIATKIIQKYEDNKIYEEAFAELCKYGITLTLIKKIVQCYGSINKAINVIKNDPYELASTIDGIGFVKSDEIGKKVGIEEDSVKRIGGYIKWWFQDKANNEGHTWVSPNQLCEAITENLKITNLDKLKETFEDLHSKNILYWNDQKTYICLKKYYDLEQDITNELKRLVDTKRKFVGGDLDKIIDEAESRTGWKFTDEQIESARNIVENPVSIVTGSSGSGKTNSVQIALNALKGKYNIKAVCLAGKAASRLSQVTKFPANTIHLALEYNPKFNAFMRNKQLPLSCDIMIIDECSFLDLYLFKSLLDALPDGCKLIMIGDIAQLEPIGIGNTFKDIIDSGVFNVNKLTKIHRQAAKSGIITKSRDISNGYQITDMKETNIQTFGELKDFTLITAPQDLLFDFIIKTFKKEYAKYNDIMKIQCITALRVRGDICIQKLNDEIQKIYNGEDVPFLSLKRNNSEIKLKLGDKVINTVNNYNTIKTDGQKTVVYNGSVGIITEVDKNSRTLSIDFGEDVGEIIIENDKLLNIDLAYAISCHKFQGSESESVIVALDMSAYALLTRQWVYTAITRAKKNCIMISENKALRQAIDTNKVSYKQTFLKEFLQEKLKKYEKV